jgi:gliding motility-associated-like protein
MKLPSLALLISLCWLMGTTLFAQHDHHSDHAFKFIENNNQWNEDVMYRARVENGYLYLGLDNMIYNFYEYPILNLTHANPTAKVPEGTPYFRSHTLKVNFKEANPFTELEQSKPSSEYYNFYLGNDRERWASNVKAYTRVKYADLYEGIDFMLYTHDEALKYDFIVQPGASPNTIQIEYEGADKIFLHKEKLMIHTSITNITEEAPYAFQIVNGKKVDVPCKFKLKGTTVSFDFPRGYDKTVPLVIDPALIFASYSGSQSDNFGMTATYDSRGNLYSGGMVYGMGFYTSPGAFMSNSTISSIYATANANPIYGITDVIVSKYDSSGSTMLYSTYLGGGDSSVGCETVHSLIVNDSNELYLFGVTSSLDFPMGNNPYDNTHGGGTPILAFVNNGTTFNPNGTDIYVTKFNSTGTALLGSTYIGGSHNDGVSYNVSGGNYTAVSAYDSLTTNYGDQFRGEVMIDDLGNCYIATTTRSNDFPIVNGFQNTSNGQQEGVVFKLNSDLSSLVWSTYIGGTEKDACYSVKVDNQYNAYVAGGTCSNDFPTTGTGVNPAYMGGKVDGYVAKISNDGSTLLNTTFVGTNDYDQAFFLELDQFNDVFVYGQTNNPSVYPVTAGTYNNPNSGQFITRFNNNLDAIVMSTVFGSGSGMFDISPSAFLVDVCSNIYVSGWGANILTAQSISGMPITQATAYQPNPANASDFYLMVLNYDATQLLYGTYFGGGSSGEHVDGGTSRFDKNGIVYQSVCAGCGNNNDFPTTTGAWSQVNNSANCNNGVFKFDFGIVPNASFVTDQIEGCAPLTVNFTNNSTAVNPFLWDFGNNDTTSIIQNPVMTFNTPGVYTATLIVFDTLCNFNDTSFKVITVHPIPLGDVSDMNICDPGPVTFTANSFGTANSFVWSSNINFTDTLNVSVADSTVTVNAQSEGYYYIMFGHPTCNHIDSAYVSFVGANITTTNDTSICGGDVIQLSVFNLNSGDTLTYDWSPDSLIDAGDGTATITVSPDYDTWYYVSGTNQYGCPYSDSVLVTVSGPPVGLLSAWADMDTIPVGSSTGLHVAPNGYTYSWTPSGSLNDPNSQHPTATPDVTTTYTVTISNNGCTRDVDVTVWVIDVICDDVNIFVPNAFTPNDDQNNDVMYVRGNNITDMYFVIYDRWGEMMFETTDMSIGWDGTYKGMKVDPAVFVYYLEVTCLGDATYFEKGNITVIK